jgi:DNA-binding transcriptional regulator WhiA
MNTLPPALREVAELRQEFPDLNLADLAAEGPDELSRSAVNHRLRRLLEAAREAGAAL